MFDCTYLHVCTDGDYNKTFFTTGRKSKHDIDHVEVEFVMALVKIPYLHLQKYLMFWNKHVWHRYVPAWFLEIVLSANVRVCVHVCLQGINNKSREG